MAAGNLLPGAGGILIPLLAGNLSPGDSLNYYFGQYVAVPGAADLNRAYIPEAGTIDLVSITARVTGTLASAEDVTFNLRLNNATDYLIGTLKYNAAVGTLLNASLAIPVVAGDYFEIKITTPAFATNPTAITHHGLARIR